MRQLITAIVSLAALPAIASAAVVANFSDGNTSSAVDGYVGMADAPGAGWAGAWTTSGSGGSSAFWANTVTNTSPISGGGNYLALNLGKSTVDIAATAHRLWDSTALDQTQPYTVTFDLRVDSSLRTNTSDSTSRVFVFGDTANSSANTGANNTWTIQAYYSTANGSSWGYTNGTGTQTTTGVAVTTDPMRFVVNVNPVLLQYSFTMTNLNTSAVYSSPTAAFRAGSAGVPRVYLGAAIDKDSSNSGTAFSFDNLAVTVPEPATAMLIGSIPALLLRRRIVR